MGRIIILGALLAGVGGCASSEETQAAQSPEQAPGAQSASPVDPAPASSPAEPTEPAASAGAAEPAETAGTKAAPTSPQGGAAGVGFMGQPETELMRRMLTAPVAKIKKGKGGRSLAFVFTFDDGSKGYYKPEQSFSGANWYAEVAAYHIDRALGFGRVPPVVARRFDWARLKTAAKGDRRISEVAVDEHGTVRGALIHWIDGKLGRASTPPGWESWVRVSSYPTHATTPFQRPAIYTAALELNRANRGSGEARPEYYQNVPTPRRLDRPAEMADLLVLDYLTHNIDRWGGGNTNLITLGERGPLLFMDNGAGFFHGPARQGLMEDRMMVQQRFRRRTVDALEALDVAALGKKMASDPLGPFLDAKLLEGLEVRRKALLQRVAALMQKHGEDSVLAW